jgi:hypothetical protein
MRVFISYAHDDAAHEDLVRDFWWFLRRNGVDAQADLTAAEDRQDWAEWMIQQIRDAERVLVVASPAYARRAEGDAEPTEGRGVQWESRLIRELMYADQRAGMRWVLPVVLPGCSPEDIPLWLRPTSAFYYRISEFTVPGAEKLLRLLTRQPSETEPPLGEPPLLPPRARPGSKPPTCHVIFWARTEEAREQAATLLEGLGLDPSEEWCTARAVSYRVNSSQTNQLRSEMEQARFPWTVVAPGLEDYLLHQLYITDLNGHRVRIFDTPAHQSVGQLRGEAAGLYGISFPEAVRLVVITEVNPDEPGRALDANETLHLAGIRDGDRLRIEAEVGERRTRVGHAFISYIHEDSHNVDRLQLALERAGIPVWRDTADLMPGEDWRERIRHAITDEALVFIACFSRNSVSRSKSYQNEELILAVEQMRLRRPDEPWLIPVRFDDCYVPGIEIGGGLTLDNIQRADLFGEHSDQHMDILIKAVRQILGH